MTTSIPTGNGKLSYGVTDCKGGGGRKTSWVTSVTFSRSIPKELSWYLKDFINPTNQFTCITAMICET